MGKPRKLEYFKAPTEDSTGDAGFRGLAVDGESSEGRLTPCDAMISR
jgi:hypothetical protein